MRPAIATSSTRRVVRLVAVLVLGVGLLAGASRALPALAMAAIKPNGDIDLRTVLRGVARNPLTLRSLVSTGIDFNRALRSLRGCRGFLLGGDSLVPADL